MLMTDACTQHQLTSELPPLTQQAKGPFKPTLKWLCCQKGRLSESSTHRSCIFPLQNLSTRCSSLCVPTYLCLSTLNIHHAEPMPPCFSNNLVLQMHEQSKEVFFQLYVGKLHGRNAHSEYLWKYNATCSQRFGVHVQQTVKYLAFFFPFLELSRFPSDKHLLTLQQTTLELT